ncbi:homolog of separase [Striga asiatica]|uniref:Homolog of separase n=1 Tax=Striga asiatica TaxID=4170 RepID=A0A5A7RFD6_STRAF|nr:homolog of separase [Striga asiatica]
METESDKGKLPSQPEQAKAITVLRSGKVVDNTVQMPGPEDQEGTKEPDGEGIDAEKIKEEESEKVTDEPALHKSPNPFKPSIPFPDRLRNEKQEKQFRDLFSMLSKHDLPKKERDPSGFIIQIALGNGKVASGMLDLGAGINLMPFLIFQRLGLGELRPTRMCLQLADRSIRYPKRIVEDVLVKNGKDHTILLGRPFIATTNTLIDVKNGTLNMTVLGETVSISVRGAMSASSVNFVEECAFIDLADPFVDEMVIHEYEEVSMPVFEDEDEPIIELFEKPVIIFAELDREKEEELIAMLQKNQKAIGWSLGDMKGISPSTCMHRLILEEGVKPFRDSQRRLNRNMMEVVKKEMLKLFSEGLIYLVASSEWVSPIHVVPKKEGITVIENDKKSWSPPASLLGGACALTIGD